MIPKPGIHRSVPFEDYRLWQAINPSAAKVILEHSPLHYKHAVAGERSTTDAMIVGAATHMLLFDADRFALEFSVWRGGRRAGRDWAEFLAANERREVIREDDYIQACRIRDAVLRHPVAADLLTPAGDAELSLCWRDPSTDLLCKGRADWVAGSVLVDLKTARDIRPWKFRAQFAQLRYHLSLGAYRDALEHLGQPITAVYVIAVEQAPPHDVAVYEVSPQTIRHGAEQWREALAQIKQCIDLDQWWGIAPQPLTLELPEWALPEPELTFEADTA